ncbi:MAG: hypothetical protein J2P15_20230, partial [Micromonosporaceae bacterium]|nr:hypothetical protein [Micromonosporaceae bacterium]
MTKAARLKAYEKRQAQLLAAHRRRNRIKVVSGAGGLIIVGLVVAIVIAVVNSATRHDQPAASPSRPLVTPANLTATGAISIGQTTAPVTLEIYLDYMCPA